MLAFIYCALSLCCASGRDTAPSSERGWPEHIRVLQRPAKALTVAQAHCKRGGVCDLQDAVLRSRLSTNATNHGDAPTMLSNSGPATSRRADSGIKSSPD